MSKKKVKARRRTVPKEIRAIRALAKDPLFVEKSKREMIFPCDCTKYNGGQCYNCLNGAHYICDDGQGKCSLSQPEPQAMRVEQVIKECNEFLVEAEKELAAPDHKTPMRMKILCSVFRDAIRSLDLSRKEKP